MSDEPIKPVEGADFATVSVDGAYVRILEGELSLMFYRDTAFPKHTKNNFPMFDEPRREIIHETRMSYPNANKFAQDLTQGLKAYYKYVELEPNDDHDAAIAQIANLLRQMPKHAQADGIAKSLVNDIFLRVCNVTEEGQVKIVELLHELISENAKRFQEIANKHPSPFDINEMTKHD
jgi:hypothetical protein